MAYNPAFVLKRISHQEILDKYLKGDFGKLSNKKDIKVSSQTTIVCEEFSADPYSGIFTYGLSKYGSPVYVSSNQKSFDSYFIDGSKSASPDCDWCHEDFDHEPTGMVVAYTKTFFTNADTGETYLYEVFWLYGNHCSPECALGELTYTKRIGGSDTSINCESSITYTKLLFTKNSGEDVTKLIPTPYFRLLKSRGGTIDRGDKHKYVASRNIILAPAKLVFEKLA
tara:strand:+ start:147 stop:824 length:678 start_codon:yes stop_codon:yes gene_type:complete